MTRHRERDNPRATPAHYAFLRVPLPISFSSVLSVPSLEPSSARKRTRSERDVKKHAPPRRIQRCSLSWIPEGASPFSFNP